MINEELDVVEIMPADLETPVVAELEADQVQMEPEDEEEEPGEESEELDEAGDEAGDEEAGEETEG